MRWCSANPETTLVIVCSKTFTTLETMSNAQLARDWIVDDLGRGAVQSTSRPCR